MNKIKLKPCPFCGAEAILETDVQGHTSIARVKCICCRTATQVFVDSDHDGNYIFDAVESWNRRVTE